MNRCKASNLPIHATRCKAQGADCASVAIAGQPCDATEPAPQPTVWALACASALASCYATRCAVLRNLRLCAGLADGRCDYPTGAHCLLFRALPKSASWWPKRQPPRLRLSAKRGACAADPTAPDQQLDAVSGRDAAPRVADLASALRDIRDRRRGANVAGAQIAVLRNDRRSDLIRHMRPVYRAAFLARRLPTQERNDALTAAIVAAKSAQAAERMAAAQRAALLDELALALAEYAQRPAEDPQIAADRAALAAAYRASKIALPHIQPLVRAVQAAQRDVTAAERSAADAESNREKKRLQNILFQRRKSLATAQQALDAALDLAAQCRIVDSRQLRDKPLDWQASPSKRARGFELTDAGGWRYDHKHVSHPIADNPTAKPWQV